GCINDCMVQFQNPNLPFGGVGASGIGSYHGKNSFDAFSHRKSIIKAFRSLDLPLRYPPYKERIKLLRKFMK
ncbi:aldehyde dehydrogenase, partial [bacterium]|nr:aldehyde dehydrogenase [bacterium]